MDLDRTGAVRDELAAVPPTLRRVVAEMTRRILIDQATRTVSWLKAGDEPVAVITPEELQALAQPILAALGSVA